MASIFSKIINGEIPAYKIAENDNFLAFLDINPMAKGHTLVIPKKEIDYIFDIDDQLLSELMIYTKKVARAIEATISCKRIGMMVIGMEVPHAHIHLIPINKESDMDFSHPRLKLTTEEFQKIATDIADEFRKL